MKSTKLASETEAATTYCTILAAPPRNIGQVGGCRRGAVHHYPLLTVEAIAALPVGRLVAADAHLWLWVTNGSFRAQGSWFYAPRQDHSRKPEEQYSIIERCSPGPYLELFARRSRPGWHSWSNKVVRDVRL